MSICAILRKTHSISKPVTTLHTHYLSLLKSAQGRVKPVAGAKHVLNMAKDKGWFVAIVTSSRHSETVDWLNNHDLACYVDLVVGGDDVKIGKPDPEPYQLALSLGNCSAKDSLAIEDSTQGALAAVNSTLPTWILASDIPHVLAGRSGVQGCLPNFMAITELL